MEIKISKTANGKDEYQLIADGNVLSSEWVRNIGEGQYYLSLSTYEDFELLAHYSFSDIPKEIIDIRVHEVDMNDDMSLTSIERSDDNQSWKVVFLRGYQFDEWGRGYSFREYYEEFKKNSQENLARGITIEPEDKSKGGHELIGNGFYLQVTLVIDQYSIAEYIERIEPIVDEFIAQVETSLDEKKFRNAIVTHFNFPKEVEIACEQYLLYFVEFLRDLGVDATADIQHEAGQVLFAVTPTGKEDAIEKIRSAFDVYLQLPANSITTVSEVSEDRIAIQRLAANVHHLNGQLMLAQALMESKNATIQAQLTTIEYQQRMLDGNVIVDSRINDFKEEKKDDKEDLLDGTLAITKYQGKGFEINLPEIFRRLKKLFNEEE